jgi:hypothetical protein
MNTNNDPLGVRSANGLPFAWSPFPFWATIQIEGQMTRTRKLLSFVLYAAMIGGGFYLLTALTIRNKGGAVAGAGAVFLMGLGGYML